MISRSAREFYADINKFAAAIDITIMEAMNKILFEAFKRIIERSPVDTGRFRASWTVQEGTPNETVQGEFVGPRKKGTKSGKGLYAAPTYPDPVLSSPYTIVWINNSLPYAVPLELGHSRQAPAGVVTITAVEISNYMHRIIREVA